jgi:uncharacterized protein YndB with AHSA1/START domain
VTPRRANPAHSGHRPTLEVTTPSDREVAMIRGFVAPRRLVFDALTKPEMLVRWFGARGWHLVECHVDLRAGGSWRFVSQGPEGSTLAHGGVYREVVTPERLVYTEVFDGQSYPGESLVTQHLRERHGVTMLTSTILYPSPEARDRALSTPMTRGVGQAYKRLDELLAEMTALSVETPVSFAAEPRPDPTNDGRHKGDA